MMIKRTEEYILKNNMIQPGDKVLAAVSGGADSVCMLMILKSLSDKMGFTLEAVHVEHGIRGAESRADAGFTVQLCQKLGVVCHMEPVDVPSYAEKAGLGLEEAARILRYGIFEKLAALEKAKVAVAHHQEDNAETVIFQMVRGSGVKGLTGIHPVSDKNGITYIRPLLFASRTEIEEFLHDAGQSFATDATNMDTAYSRNKLRHDVFPMLEQINDQAVRHINESARQLDIMYDFYEKQLKDACGKAIHRKGSQVILGIEAFNRLHPALQSGVARECIHMAAGRLKDIGSVHIGMLMELTGMQSGKAVNLPYGITAVRSYDQIVLSSGHEEGQGKVVDNDDRSEITVNAAMLSDILEDGSFMEIKLGDSGGKIALRVFDFDGKMDEIPKKPYTKWLDYDKMKKGFEIRKRRAGDYIVVDDEGHRKKLKAFFINEKVPAAIRNDLWLIAQDSSIQSIMGYRSAQSALVTASTQEVLDITFFTEAE